MLGSESLSRHAPRPAWPLGLPIAALCAFALLCAMPAAARTRHHTGAAPDARQVSTEKSGRLVTHPGLHLHLTTDVGNVKIFTDATDEVRYRVRISTDASQASAADLVVHYALTATSTATGTQITGAAPANAPVDALWVDYEIHVPRRYSLDITTQAGNIETQDIAGHIVLSTGGGDVTAGRVGPILKTSDASARDGEDYSARIETQGGHIVVGDVAGNLRASTAGGHISTGDVRGQVELHTGGGHIHTGSIAGGELGTKGGNIVVERSSSGLVVSTDGGQISVGEVSGGPVRARTGGGAIHIVRISGPTEVESTRGNIALTCLEGPLRASTSQGSITAWFLDQDEAAQTEPTAPTPARKVKRATSASDLESGNGDIVVYLPRELPITIEATVEQSSMHQIVADPSLPLKVDHTPGPGGAVRAQCNLNGGGDVLRLRTDDGNIVLRYGDAAAAMLYTQAQMEQLHDQIETQVEAVLNSEALSQVARETAQGEMQRAMEKAQRQEQAAEQEEGGFERLAMRLEQMWWGDVHVDADTQEKKILTRVAPNYPDVARQAGVEGTVALRVEIGQDGSVQDVEPISGPPLLERAAAEAVAKWRYAPTLVDGNPVNVITTVSVEFHLN
ncbi:MAG: TonB family protein [Candidatus Acidiferrales bacterium]|jgi:TonB family protein